MPRRVLAHFLSNTRFLRCTIPLLAPFSPCFRVTNLIPSISGRSTTPSLLSEEHNALVFTGVEVGRPMYRLSLEIRRWRMTDAIAHKFRNEGLLSLWYRFPRGH